jgi:uncharacterized membrane protein
MSRPRRPTTDRPNPAGVGSDGEIGVVTLTDVRHGPRRPRRLTGVRTVRLSALQRKTLLLLHIAAGGAWLGLDVAVAVLVFTARATSDPGTKAFCFRALELVAIWPMAVAALISLVTGVLLGVGTKYGLLRYWWVLVKLAMNIVLFTLVLVLLRPGLHEAADFGHRVADGLPASFDSGSLLFPPIVSTSALLFAMVLSVFKPWGRTRKATR